jgi:hypothetical protein
VAFDPFPEREFPEPPSDVIYHGLLGRIVGELEPGTEADPLVLLTTGLAFAGVCFGGNHALLDGSERTNVFVVHVGETSIARKGTGLRVMRQGWRLVYPLLEDELWVPHIQSGEGLVAHFARKAPEPRAVIVEDEFGRLLTVMTREGMTLSSELRSAYDGSPLGVTRSRQEEKVVDHHVGLVGQVTPVDLRAKLTSADAANGFANRLLFVAVRRRRTVLEPASPRRVFQPFAADLGRVIREASAHSLPVDVGMDAGARGAWESFKAAEDARQPLGLAGALIARSTSHAARLALIYMLLDRDDEVREGHMRAAVELVRYGQRSVRWAFGDSTGNRHSDALLRELQGGPLMWTTAKRTIGLGHAADMDEAVRVLVEAGRVRVAKAPGGRARWLQLSEGWEKHISHRGVVRSNGRDRVYTYAPSTAAAKHNPPEY